MLKGFIKSTAAALAATGVAVALKNGSISAPAAAARAANAIKVEPKDGEGYGNGVALTPPMGWSSWNTFRNHISEELILQIATAMRDSGLKEAGYTYINLDDCWQSSVRDEAGKLTSDYNTFPRGIRPLVDDINEMGLKVGIYSSNGTFTCEDLPASLGHEAVDAATFAEWGIEYFKYDFCHNKPFPTSAPNIERIIVSGENGEDIVTCFAAEARLEGHARVVSDSRHPASYITGLSANIGSAAFMVTVPEDGKYPLSIIIRKRGKFTKYAKVLVNGSAEYEIWAAGTNAMTTEGKLQLCVELKAGENEIKFFNPYGSRMDAAAAQYTKMGQELKKATKAYAEMTGTEEKPICYSICEWGLNRPWHWGKQAGNLWRTTMDINASWASIVSIYEQNVRLAKHAGPGGWNDPDMLEVGNGSLTEDENKAHFALWCMMAAPLILGNDIRRFIDENGNVKADDETLKILTNKDLIAIDQDELGVQARRYKTNIKVDVLVKPLVGGEIAVCFFNKFGEESAESININDLLDKEYCNLPRADEYKCKELWSGDEFETEGTLSVNLAPHSVKIYRIKADD